MRKLRWQMRWLFLGLMGTGVIWLHITNYVRLGQTPLEMLRRERASTLVLWGGILLLGLVLDLLAGLRLRRFFAALARLEAGRRLEVAELRTAAAEAIAFPGRAALILAGLGAGLAVLFHLVRLRGDLLPILLDPARAAARVELLNLALRELLLAVVLALLVFTFSRRILQRAVIRFALLEVPKAPHLSIGVRVMAMVLVIAATYTSLFATTPANVPTSRMLWLYIPLIATSGLVGYLLAGDTGRDLRLVSGRLRILAAGLRPDLFHRLAVTGQDEVAELLAAINALQDRVEAEFAAFERDLQDARSVQTGMLPRVWQAPAGWDLAVRLEPAQEVGGDFYDIIPLPDGRLGVALGDAAGKGLPAALLMASTVSLLRSHAPRHAGPAAVLAAVNRLLCGSLPPMTFVTIAYAVVDPGRREVTLASAGHLPPLVGGREAEPLPSLPLGVEPDTVFGERTYRLEPGESFVLCSDGLVEATDGAGRLLGVEPLAAVLCRGGQTAGALVDELLAAVTRHTGGRPRGDDITALVLLPPAAAEAPALARLQAAPAAGGGWGVS